MVAHIKDLTVKYPTLGSAIADMQAKVGTGNVWALYNSVKSEADCIIFSQPENPYAHHDSDFFTIWLCNELGI